MEDRSRGLRKGTWTAEEDSLLRKCIENYGEGKWHQVPSRAGLNRCRKSCRLRWLNYLKPNIKRGRLSPDEVDLVIRLHKLLGNRWSLIAGRLPGRTANDVKNYWNTHLSKKHDQSNCKKKAITSKKQVVTTRTPTEPVQKIDVIKPRPRSFSSNRNRPLLNAPKEAAFPRSSSNNNNSSSSNKDDGDNVNDVNENVNGCKSCNKPMMMNAIVDQSKESMWWEGLLDESEEATEEEKKIMAAAAAAAEEAESSWMNSAATFDVDLWNLLNE